MRPLSLGGPFAPAPDWTAENNLAFSFFGYSVASAGDVNGDGYDDAVMSTMPVAGAEHGRGQLYVYYGSATGLGSTPAWTFETQGVRSFLAFSLFSAGDVNGDGFDDILVGEPRAYLGGTDYESRVYAFYGSAAGLSTTANWTVAGADGLGFGWNTSPAGDVNGDGYGDVAVGEHGTSSYAGRVYVYHGSAAGLSTTAALTIVADKNFTFFGQAVAPAGDVNGDGFDDLVVGEPGYSRGTEYEGRVHVFFGSDAGLITSATWTVMGDDPAGLFGDHVAGAGDLNGDGYDDILVRQAKFDDQEVGDMCVHVFYGSPTVMSTTADWSSVDKHDRISRLAMASAGDVNGDGYGDIIIGGRQYGTGNDGALVYFGSSAGLSSVADQYLSDGQESSSFGLSVASAGDLDNDGYSDLIIGAPLHDNGQENEGRVAVYYGAETTTDVDEEESHNTLFASVAGNVIGSSEPLALNVKAGRAGTLHVQVYNMPGAVLLQRSAQVGTGNQRMEISLPSLPAGRYFARLTMADGRVVALPFSVR